MTTDLQRSDGWTSPSMKRRRRRRSAATAALVVCLVGALVAAACGQAADGWYEADGRYDAALDSPIGERSDESPLSAMPDVDAETEEFESVGDAVADSPAPPAPEIDADPSTNLFAETTINPWVETATDPMSTFALDVDTASHTIVRSYLERGMLPPAEAVRVEEIVNAIDYAYPDPDDGHDLRIELSGSSTPFTSEQGDVRLMRVGVQSRRIDDADRRDAALTFVVDTSGSMGRQGRLELVKSSLTTLVDRLRPTDTVALVEFGSRARVILEHTPVRDSDTIVAAVDDLRTSGQTNIEHGLELGYDQARSGFRAGAINRVVLAGDGVANVGVADPDELAAQVRDHADDGIQLLTLGFGMGNYSDHLMEQISNDGDGFYAYIDSEREADRLFGPQLVSTLETLALDAKIQVTFDPAQVSAFRLVGFENRGLAHEDFRDDEVDAGDIGAGHSVTALYEVRLVPGADPAAALATVSLRWADIDTGDVTELSAELAAADITGAFTEAPASLQRAAVAAYYAEVLRASPFVAQRGVTMVEVDRAARSVRRAHGDGGRFDELVDLVSEAAALGASR